MENENHSTHADAFSREVRESLRLFLLDNQYILQEQIGIGGFSLVFRVESLRFGENFAAKITNISSSRHQCAAISALNEENALRQFDHPHIIRLYECFSYESFSILILELCNARSLYTLMKDPKGVPVPNLRTMIPQIMDAISYIHSHHHVHRDIKPGNILLDGYGRPKVADFGLCVPWDESRLMTDFIGTRYYFSPEIFARRPFNPYKADLWALGVTFYEMAVGLIVWPTDRTVVGESVRDGGIVIPPSMPPDIARLLRPMLNINADRRPDIEIMKSLVRFDRGTFSGPRLSRLLGVHRPSDVRKGGKTLSGTVIEILPPSAAVG
jgi:serine/threonine protein kinase